MKKFIITIIVTMLLMLLLFYHLLLNAKVTFGYTIDNRQIVSVDVGFEVFNYWED